MSLVQLSSTGRVACGGSFLDMYGNRPPATIQTVHPAGILPPPPLVSWSAFPASKKLHVEPTSQKDRNDTNAAGEHVALAFFHAAPAPSQELFFAVAVFRCDTWALQWAVRADSIGDGQRVCDVCCLSASTVAFLVGGGDTGKTKKKGGRKQLFFASKADVPRVGRRENRQWRSFLAKAHRVEIDFEGEDVCSMQALSATSCLLLTSAGRLVRATASLGGQHMEVTTEEVEVSGGLIALTNNNNNNNNDTNNNNNININKNGCKLAVSSRMETKLNNEGSNYHLAVIAAGGQACSVMKLVNTKTSVTVGKPQAISLPKETTVERAEFAGPHILVLTLAPNNKKSPFSLHMTCLVPSSSSSSESPFNCVFFEPVRMTAHRVPLATMYFAERDTHVVLARRPHDGEVDGSHHNNTRSINERSEDAWWSCLEYAELSLREGPYTEEVFRSATWCMFPEPTSTLLPTVSATNTNDNDNADDDDDDDDDGDENGRGGNTAADLQRELALLNNRQSGVHWDPVRLHYALATCLSDEPRLKGKRKDIAVNVIAVETAPYVHTRLVRQWHNATRGLRFLLNSAADDVITVGGAAPFAVAWNPRHIRRALRLFSQDGLHRLFADIASALRMSATASTTTASGVFYGSSVTAATEVALHAITLSRQMGAALSPDDVAVVVLLLRASREAGHLIVSNITRGRLLLESAVRSRLANRVLGGVDRNNMKSSGGNDTHANEEEEEAGVDVHGEKKQTMFLNVPSELRVERALRTKYTTDTWSQHLQSKSAEYSAVVAGALQHLKDAIPLQQQQQDEEDDDNGDNNTDAAASGAGGLSDWAVLGRRPHPNAAFTVYESSLLHPHRAEAM